MFNFLKGLVAKANAKLEIAQLSRQAKLLVALKRAATTEEAAHHYNCMWANTVSKKWAIEEAYEFTLSEPNWFDRILVWFYQDLD